MSRRLEAPFSDGNVWNPCSFFVANADETLFVLAFRFSGEADSSMIADSPDLRLNVWNPPQNWDFDSPPKTLKRRSDENFSR